MIEDGTPRATEAHGLAADLLAMIATMKPGGTGATRELTVVDEYGTLRKSGDRVVWDTAPYIEKAYPLAEKIEAHRQDGKVYRRRIIVVDEWAEVQAKP